jgi:hypothetical protein
LTSTPTAAARSFVPPVPQPVVIEGPAGPLEARVEDPEGGQRAPQAVAVVCHPHPLHGGTMQNKVVHTVARAMQEAGAATVRFNFRGVGRSAGVHDGGVGEVEDVLAVARWAQARWNGPVLWLGGFSFGAAVALQAALALETRRLVTVAPPVGRLITRPVARPGCPWLIVQGDADELVDCGAVRRWAGDFSPPPELLVLAGAEHFFHGRLVELRSGVLEFLRETASREK